MWKITYNIMACWNVLLNQTKMHIINFFIDLVRFSHQNAFNTITSQHSKLRTYGKIKKHIGFEEYLTDVTNVEHRVAMTKLKLSNHKLMIDVGRHDNIDINNRLCPPCSVIESESHFLLSCSYSDLRKHLFPMTINNYSSDENLEILFNNRVWSKNLAKYIKSASEIRTKYINTCWLWHLSYIMILSTLPLSIYITLYFSVCLFMICIVRIYHIA